MLDRGSYIHIYIHIYVYGLTYIRATKTRSDGKLSEGVACLREGEWEDTPLKPPGETLHSTMCVVYLDEVLREGVGGGGRRGFLSQFGVAQQATLSR